MFTITPIGSCRITTPLKRGQERHGFALNMDKCYGYCHSPAEAVQMAQFMLGQIDIPADIWPLVSRSHDFDQISATSHAPSDLYIVELASAKEVTIDGVSIQLNYLNATYADFFADKDRAHAYWDIVETGNSSDKSAFLAAHWSTTEIQAAQSKMLNRISMRRVTQQSLENDLRRLDALLPKVLIVSHIDACKVDGQKIGSRSAFIEMVKAAALKTRLIFDNPTDLMDRFGQSAALEDESAGLAHFTPAFGDALMHHWMRTVIAPITDHAATRDEAAINDWFVPQIMASFGNGEISDAVARAQNLKQISPSMQFLADEINDIQATSQAAFETCVRAAINDVITDDACIALVEEANGLGRIDLALEIVANSKSGVANLSQFMSLTLAERALHSGMDTEALAFLSPYLEQGHDAAIEMFAAAYLKADRIPCIDLPQSTITKILECLDMKRRMALINLMGLDTGLALSAETTAQDVVLATKNVEKNHGFIAAHAFFASWHEQQDRKATSDSAITALLDEWVASSMSHAKLAKHVERLSLILNIAPRHASAREAQRVARQDLMAQIRAAGDAGDLAALDALAPTVAKLPALPEYDLWRARLSFNNGDYSSAIQSGERAAVDMPEKINIWVLLMRAANRTDRFEQAAQYARNVVRLSKKANENLRIEAQTILHAECVGG